MKLVAHKTEFRLGNIKLLLPFNLRRYRTTNQQIQGLRYLRDIVYLCKLSKLN